MESLQFCCVIANRSADWCSNLVEEASCTYWFFVMNPYSFRNTGLGTSDWIRTSGKSRTSCVFPAAGFEKIGLRRFSKRPLVHRCRKKKKTCTPFGIQVLGPVTGFEPAGKAALRAFSRRQDLKKSACADLARGRWFIGAEIKRKPVLSFEYRFWSE